MPLTRRGRPEPKGINYRMSPENFPVISAAGIDCCMLANNHVLDWGGQPPFRKETELRVQEFLSRIEWNS